MKHSSHLSRLLLLVMLTIQCFVVSSCRITGQWDIIWLLDAARGSTGDEDDGTSFEHVKKFVSNFTTSSLMLSLENVHQGFLQFGGPLDFGAGIDTSDITTIGPNLEPDNIAAANQSLFLDEIHNLHFFIGSNDLTGAINFVKDLMLPFHCRNDSTKVVFLVTDSGPTDAQGRIQDPFSTEQAVIALKAQQNVHFYLIRTGVDFPVGFLQGIADNSFQTTPPTMSSDLIDDGILCSLFTTFSPSRSPSVSPSLATQNPTTKGSCLP
jgi:hypothetical protein